MIVPLYQLDAFASRLFAGNPAAVVVLEDFPEDSRLQAIAAENNLAETAFLVPNGNDFFLRWFTPTVEVPLCGHATLASAAVVMERLDPQRKQVTFQTASGPLGVVRTEAGYVLDFPARPMAPTPVSGALVAALRVRPQESHEDRFNYLALLEDADQVRRLRPDLAAVARLDRSGLIVTARGDNGYDFVSRYFAPAKGIPEDPVTGGAHCALAPFWAARLKKSAFHAFQASARGGELLCRFRADRVELEGSCVFYLEGEAEI